MEKKRKRNFLTSAIISFTFLLLVILNAQAGTIAPELRSTLQTAGPDQDVPVIITLSDKVDPASFTDHDKGLRRSRIIGALKEKSDASQRPLKAFLQNKGISRFISLWI